MVSCTEFILAYNELFKFLEEGYGKRAVIKFWEYISDEFLTNLDKLVREKGISGMVEYWTHALTEEGAAYEMKVGENYFEIFMKKCPSVDILNKRKSEKYSDYCGHCPILYRRVIKKYGFSYYKEFIDREKGICRVLIKKRK